MDFPAHVICRFWLREAPIRSLVPVRAGGPEEGHTTFRRHSMVVGGRRQLDGVESGCFTKADALKNFTPLELDVFHARWNHCYPTRDDAQPAPARKRPYSPFARRSPTAAEPS